MLTFLRMKPREPLARLKMLCICLSQRWSLWFRLQMSGAQEITVKIYTTPPENSVKRLQRAAAPDTYYYYYLRQRKRYMFMPVFVCLSVSLLARLLKNVCMDLDEMLRGTWTN